MNKFKIKNDALLSLQFWKEKGILKFSITTRNGNLLPGNIFGNDYELFGRNLSESKFLSEGEKMCFESFCNSYLRYRLVGK